MMATVDAPAKLMSIQYVRAAAAVIVVGWHTGWSYTVLGQAGVDLFFVVSGFVMRLVSARETSPSRFGLARLLRIVPLYWAVTLVTATLDRPSARKLLTSLFFWPDGPYPIVLQGWSLNLEMMYYLLFALALLGAPRMRLRWLTVEFVLLCVVAPIVLPASEAVTTCADPIAMEFLAGAGLYRLWETRRLPVGFAAWALGTAGVIALAATHLLGGGQTGWLRVALWGMPAMAIVAAGLGIERAGQLPRLPLLSMLGEGSYSIYLTHLLAIRAVGHVLHTLWAPLALSIAILWCCLVGYAVHRAIERPAHRLTSGLLRRFWPRPVLHAA